MAKKPTKAEQALKKANAELMATIAAMQAATQSNMAQASSETAVPCDPETRPSSPTPTEHIDNLDYDGLRSPQTTLSKSGKKHGPRSPSPDDPEERDEGPIPPPHKRTRDGASNFKLTLTLKKSGTPQPAPKLDLPPFRNNRRASAIADKARRASTLSQSKSWDDQDNLDANTPPIRKHGRPLATIGERQSQAATDNDEEPEEGFTTAKTGTRRPAPTPTKKMQHRGHKPSINNGDDNDDDLGLFDSPASKPTRQVPPAKRSGKRKAEEPPMTDDKPEEEHHPAKKARRASTGKQCRPRQDPGTDDEGEGPFVGSSDEEQDLAPAKGKHMARKPARTSKWPLSQPPGEAGHKHAKGRPGFNLREAMGYPTLDPHNKTNKYVMKNLEFQKIISTTHEVAAKHFDKSKTFTAQTSDARDHARQDMKNQLPYFKDRYVDCWPIKDIFKNYLENSSDHQKKKDAKFNAAQAAVKAGRGSRQTSAKAKIEKAAPSSKSVSSSKGASAVTNTKALSSSAKVTSKKTTQPARSLWDPIELEDDFIKPAQGSRPKPRRCNLKVAEPEVSVPKGAQGKTFQLNDDNDD